MNTGYVIWFAVLVVVAGAALLWLAIGVVPEIPPDSGQGVEPGVAHAASPARMPGVASEKERPSEPGSGPGPGLVTASESAGQDGIAGSS